MWQRCAMNNFGTIVRYIFIFVLIFILQNSIVFAQAPKTVLLPTKKIIIEGTEHFDSSDIYEAVSADVPGFFSFGQKEVTIKVKQISSIKSSLRAFFDSEGYYDATFVVKENNDTVSVFVKEGIPVRVEDINITSDFDISDLVNFHKGDIFRAKTFISTKSRIIESLLHEGYCSYNLDTKAYVDLEKHTVNLVFNLKKGGVCTFGKVTVKGLKTIDERIVKSCVRAKEGARFNTELVQNTSSALYGLHAFDSVLIDVDKKFYNVVPVDITLKEMEEPYHVELGAGYDTYIGPRVHGTFTKHNFLGNAQQLSLILSWSSLEQVAILDFYKPVIASLYGIDVDLGTSIGYSNLEFDGFRETKTFAKAYLKYEDEVWRILGGFALENIDISELSDGEKLLPEYAYDTFLLAYPYLDVIYDKRDSKLNPKYGYYLAGSFEMGVPTNSEASLYFKSQLEARAIYTISQLTMAVVGKIGAIDIQTDSLRGIPESKKFFAGGAYFNRAYGYREIGVVVSPTEDLINGALSMANLSVEMDYPILGDSFYGAVFSDNTMLTDKSYDYSGKIISSAGVGVRYMTPVGPFKFDIGFNTHDPSIYGISFQIGQSF